MDIKIKHLGKAYGEQQILKDFSCLFPEGKTTCIRGKSGSGKTTLLRLLLGLESPDTGEIEGMEGKKIAAVFQEDRLCENLSAASNIRMVCREPITDQQLEEACRACGIYHFIETLPHGFDTVLDDSIAISSGQKQLLTIARAMIQGNPMLILDEATSSVDTRTELITQQAMDRLTEHRTSFVIAHRLSTIKNADLILVLKDGDIIEQGTHKELLAKGGFYADLYNSQFEKAS